MAVWSEVSLSIVGRTLRFDAEYYQPDFLAYEAQANKSGGVLTQFIDTIIQPTEFIRQYDETMKSAIFWRAQNIKPGYIDTDKVEYISRSIFDSIPNSHVSEGDILITRTGANAGDCAVVPNGISEVAISSHTLRLIPSSIELGYAIGTFFASDLGRKVLFRSISGSSRPQITKEILSAIQLPNFTSIAKEVTDIVRAFYSKQHLSKTIYAKAEALLLRELGLSNLDLSHELTYERNFSEVAVAGRYDAGYFQPKYYRLLNAIENGKYEYRTLASIIEPIRNGYDYREFIKEGTPYIRVGDVKKGQINIKDTAKIGIAINEVKKDVRLIPGDILFTRKGSFGNAAVVREEQESSVISSEIMLLRLLNDDHSPDYLALYLNSLVGFQQVERYVHGAAFYSISQPDLGSVLVILPPREIQNKITELVQQSIKAYEDAKQFLEDAKHRVEEMILKGE